ncbi:MAG: Lrp/AsnC family transcriptional regulator [Chloroflexota bacterium]
MNNTRNTNEIDKTGRVLLLTLQKNARLSYAELGRIVGLTPTAVAERVRKLEDRGVISGYHAAVSLERLGYPMTVFVRLRSGQLADQALMDQIMQVPEALSCHSITGEDCLIIEIVAESVLHLRTVLGQLAEFGQTTTSLVLFSAEKKETPDLLLP